MTFSSLFRVIKLAAGCVFLWGLAACASDPAGSKPAELVPNPALLGVRSVWSNKLGAVEFPLSVAVVGRTVTLASSDGAVVSQDAASGKVLWQTNLQTPISAGVGADNRFASVVTRGNELVTLEGAKEIWRSRLKTQVLTAPLVAGGRVFVLGADRSVSAFDAASGRKLWADQRPGDALVLRQAGVLVAVRQTLIVGLAGQLVGLNPLNGQTLWSAPIATPRGTNEVERLVDLVAGVGNQTNLVCARAFQTAVGCVDALRGNVVWKKTASGSTGLHSEDGLLFGVEGDGRLMAWQLSDGQVAWTSDGLRYRQISAPLALGRSLVVGDASGIVHVLSRSDGSVLNRLTTDGSAIAVKPVVAAETLVVVTRSGGVFGFQPE